MGIPWTCTEELCMSQTETPDSHHVSILFFPVHLIFCFQAAYSLVNKGPGTLDLMKSFLPRSIWECHLKRRLLALLLFDPLLFPSLPGISQGKSLHSTLIFYSPFRCCIGFVWQCFGSGRLQGWLV